MCLAPWDLPLEGGSSSQEGTVVGTGDVLKEKRMGNLDVREGEKELRLSSLRIRSILFWN